MEIYDTVTGAFPSLDLLGAGWRHVLVVRYLTRRISDTSYKIAISVNPHFEGWLFS